MRILITAGPTREYLDDVRFLSNASSGKMGYALAASAQRAGHEVILVSGPVDLVAPAGCRTILVETTGEMHAACEKEFPHCDGVIGAAAVCDYRPKVRKDGKLAKTGAPVFLEMIETEDVLGSLGRSKGSRWIVGFALEASNGMHNARRKLVQKNCDAIVLNHPEAIGGDSNSVELIDRSGNTSAAWQGTKTEIAALLIEWIEQNLVAR